MKRGLLCWLAVCMLLVGCAAPTIRSDVTTFHEWPAELPAKTYVFERSREQDNNLEYRSYENLVRAELQRLGFIEAAPNTQPALKVTLSYRLSERDVRVVQPVIVHASPGFGHPFYGPRWPGMRFYDPFFPDPFWHTPVVTGYEDRSYRVYTRQLNVRIARMADGRKLFDVTVVSEGGNPSLARVMPYMIKSAFSEFPGRSGVPRRVELPFRE